MQLEGKGLYIWKIHRCEDGDPVRIVQRAQSAGLSHVLVKIADGARSYNVDLAGPVVDALKGAGLQVWGWQFVYGEEPFAEAEIAAHRIKALALDGFVVNAEDSYKGKHAQASAYMELLRERVGDLPVALSSYRYPNYHPELPWTEFLSHCDVNMPQVYWVQANNPDQQLDRSKRQFDNIYPVVPIIPTGSAYEEFGWRPQASEVVLFMRHAREQGFPAANFWSWDYAGSDAGRDFWDAIADFDWPLEEPVQDVVESLLTALTAGDVNAVVELYHENAVLVTSRHTIQGHANLRKYFAYLLRLELPGAEFVLETRHNAGHIRHVRWDARATTNGKQVNNGQDTIQVRKGKIQYHSSIYRIA